MKIVNRSEFMKLPSNTLFSTYAPCYFGPLTIKGETSIIYGEPVDWNEQQIIDAIKCNNSCEWAEKLDHAEKTGESVSFDFDCEGRNGLFDDNQLYAVWEQDDLKALIKRLQQCIN